MANVHFKKHLIHQCTVERSTPAQSGSGEPIDSWGESPLIINCRYVEKRERIADAALGLMVRESHILLCNTGEDVQEEDRIKDIVLRSDSSSVDAGPFMVRAFLNRSSTEPHHISLELERAE